MSIQLGYACITCKRLAPNIGDGGYLGTPTLVVAEESTIGVLAGSMPSFGLFYEGLAAIGLLPHDLERVHEFLVEHAAHRLFMTGDGVDGDDVPDDVREFQEDDTDDIGAEMDALDAERERRVASGEFVEAYFVVACGPCQSDLKATESDLLKAHTGKAISEADAETFVAAWDRAPDDGWNHRLMGIVEPYQSFMPDLVKFIAKHATHGLFCRLLRAPVGSSHYHSRRTL